jgi:DNA repair photolyase
MIEPIQAKTILSKVKNDSYFGLTYNMNLYRGCQHACIYCDSRSTCYQLGELSQIRYKSNALELLEKELRSKKVKGTIGFGSMNDPYMPVEQKMELTRKALLLVAKYHYPLHLITKSSLVVRDIDMLQKISQVYAAISITITTSDDELAKIIEPNSPLPSKRFEALKTLSKNGIYCGITLMPILPFINDTEKNINDLIYQAKESGVKYIIPFMGLTLREGSREYFYKQLDKSFPGVKEQYIKSFGNNYICNSTKSNELYKLTYSLLKKWNIPDKIEFYKPLKIEQLKLF